MIRTIAVLSLVLSLTAGSGAFSAQSKGQDKGRGKAASKDASPGKPSQSGSGFDPTEIRIIREWFSSPSNLKGLPPGLAKRDELPPGLQKQLARNGQLPPGLQKRVQPLPRDLELRLPRLPDGRRRLVIAGNVILLEEKTATILDILQNIF